MVVITSINVYVDVNVCSDYILYICIFQAATTGSHDEAATGIEEG